MYTPLETTLSSNKKILMIDLDLFLRVTDFVY